VHFGEGYFDEDYAISGYICEELIFLAVVDVIPDWNVNG